MSDNPLREIAEIAALSGQERYAEGRAQAFKEAAEVARVKHALYAERVCRAPKAHMFDLGAEWAARYIAEAIEAAAKGGQK